MSVCFCPGNFGDIAGELLAKGLGIGVEAATIDVAGAQGISDVAGAMAGAEGAGTGGGAVVRRVAKVQFSSVL
jgi:hypothetical protein